jgi:hypothetical protein
MAETEPAADDELSLSDVKAPPAVQGVGKEVAG